jgi:hypothetical protein
LIFFLPDAILCDFVILQPITGIRRPLLNVKFVLVSILRRIHAI